MDIIDFPDGEPGYITRVTKAILPNFALFIVVAFFAAPCQKRALMGDTFFSVFGSELLLISPLAIITILSALYQCKYYLTKVACTGNTLELSYFKFGRKKSVSMEMEKIKATIKVPHLSRSENYVLVFKYEGRVVARQYTYGNWTKDAFKEFSPKLKELLGSNLVSRLNNDKGSYTDW